MVECVAWGVDYSTKAVSLGMDRNGMPLWFTVALPREREGAARLADAHAVLLEFFTRHARDYEPDVVVLEQPFGNVQPVMQWVLGVIQSAAAQAVDCPILLLDPSSWKLRATGYGAHKKPTPKKLGRPVVFGDYGVAVWARQQGYTGRVWDECDAIGIARAGALLYARDLRASVA